MAIKRMDGRCGSGVASILHCPWQRKRGPGFGQPPAAQIAGLEPRLRSRDPAAAQDHHQGGGKAETAVGGRWHGRAARVAVGRAQHLPPPGPGPDLGVQLLPRIDAKPASPLRLRLPDIEAGPEAPYPPGGAAARCVTGTNTLSQHQGTALPGGGSPQQPLQNRQLLTTNDNRLWPELVHSATVIEALPTQPGRK